MPTFGNNNNMQNDEFLFVLFVSNKQITRVNIIISIII